MSFDDGCTRTFSKPSEKHLEKERRKNRRSKIYHNEVIWFIKIGGKGRNKE
jgi:hypothetical protein